MIIYQAICSKFQDKWPAPNSHSIKDSVKYLGLIVESESLTALGMRQCQ